jgi:hypothetical protein
MDPHVTIFSTHFRNSSSGEKFEHNYTELSFLNVAYMRHDSRSKALWYLVEKCQKYILKFGRHYRIRFAIIYLRNESVARETVERAVTHI